VGIEIKTGRGGLGEELHRKRRQEERVAMQVVMAKKRMRHEAEWRNGVISKHAEREQEKDLVQSQRVCRQLDEEQVCHCYVILCFKLYCNIFTYFIIILCHCYTINYNVTCFKLYCNL